MRTMVHPIRLAVLATILGFNTLAMAQPADGRELGFAVSTAQDGDLAAAIGRAQAACMSTIHISIGWKELHPDTVTWNADVLENLDLINLYFAALGVKVELQIGPVNTVVDQLPIELVGLPYDDPRVIRDMQRTVDTVFAHLPDVELAALNISNESDAYWGTNLITYTQFGNMMQTIVPYAKAHYQTSHGDTLSVGTTFTWFGLTDPQTASLCQIANAYSDHISVTYYPILNDFTVKPPSAVIQDLALLVTMQSGPQPIRLAEIGCPSSTTCVSSEAIQAQFVEAAFTAWDQHMDRIPYMGWFLLTDWDSATVDTLGTYYGISDPVFLEYLRTLGLRTWQDSGMDKLAYPTLLCELQARNFCATNCVNAVAEEEMEQMLIFPNPASGKIRISGIAIKDGDPVQFISMQGRRVSILPFAAEMDVSMFAPGAYMVRMADRPPIQLLIVGW